MDYNWEYNNCHIFVEIITKQLYYNFNILFKGKIMLPNTKKYKKKVQEHLIIFLSYIIQTLKKIIFKLAFKLIKW